jgi:UDP-N-acetylmuramoyl-tripeptide--D-alanyl-D-alanine ligase
VGPLSAAAAQAFGDGGMHFESREALTLALQASLQTGVTCLVKGSRSAGMDQVVTALRLHPYRGGDIHAA